jgi:hypothetical protein
LGLPSTTNDYNKNRYYINYFINGNFVIAYNQSLYFSETNTLSNRILENLLAIKKATIYATTIKLSLYFVLLSLTGIGLYM